MDALQTLPAQSKQAAPHLMEFHMKRLLTVLVAGIVLACLFVIGGCAVGLNKRAESGPHYLDDMLSRRLGAVHEL